MKRAFRTVVFTLVLGCELLFKQKRENKEAKTNSIHLSVKQGTSHNGAIVLCNLKPHWMHPQPRRYRGKFRHFMFWKTAGTLGDFWTIPVISRPDYIHIWADFRVQGEKGVSVAWQVSQLRLVPKPIQNISPASSQRRAKIAPVYRKTYMADIYSCDCVAIHQQQEKKPRSIDLQDFQSRLGNSHCKHTVPVLTCGEDSLRRILHWANLDFFTSQGSSVQLSLSRLNVIGGTWPAGSSDLCTFPVDLRVSPLSFLRPPWALIRAHFASGSLGIGGYHGTLLWR